MNYVTRASRKKIFELANLQIMQSRDCFTYIHLSNPRRGNRIFLSRRLDIQHSRQRLNWKKNVRDNYILPDLQYICSSMLIRISLE